MKRYLVLAFFFTALILAHGTAAQPTSEGDDLPGRSLYQLSSPWMTQQGKAVTLRELQGRPYLVALVFTHCGYACPTIVRDMKRIAGQLSTEEREALGCLLVTVDPERDTVERLRAFAKTHDLDADRWTLLRSEDVHVRTLAAALGVRYKKESSGNVVHSNVITLLDQQGVIVRQQKGLGSDATVMSTAITDLLSGSPSN